MSSRPTAVFLALALVSAGAGAREYTLSPDSDVIGEIEIIHTHEEDTFRDLGRRYDVGRDDLIRANPDVDPWLPGEGTKLIIPSRYVLPDAPRQGIVLNIPELRLYYFPPDDPDHVITYPVGIGREGWDTPYGKTTVTDKKHLPSWYPPASVRAEHAAEGDLLPAVVPPGPDNPLGEHELKLGFPSYLIHGTNKPAGIGMRVSHGCIRLYPEDIAALFAMVPVGTQVLIVNQPYKMGWGDDGLYVEAHPPLAEESDEWTATELTRIYVAATAKRRVQVRWNQAEAVMNQANGMPEFVSVKGTITLADAGE